MSTSRSKHMHKLSEPEPDFNCPVCGFTLWLPVASLRVSTLGLYDDARFPGRCLLALDEHVEDILDLDSDIACAFWLDARDAAKAIAQATRPRRMNYAILGNAVAHVHLHLIPRPVGGDPIPHKSPWSHPEPVSPLPSDAVPYLLANIARALASPSADGSRSTVMTSLPNL